MTRQRLAIAIERIIYALSLVTLLWLLALVSGCARFHSEQVETAADGTQRTTHIYVTTIFDAHSDLTKLRATTTDRTQGMNLAGLSESATSTNLVQVLQLIAALAAATAK